MDFLKAKDFILEEQKTGLSPELTYHSLEHILDVYEATKRLAELEGISDETELQLLLTAALFHDSGFMLDRKNHENLSCQIAKEHLPSFGYLPEQIDWICALILVTKIPSFPKNKWEEILCDADLDYLGRTDFEAISEKLFQELKNEGLMKDRKEWNQVQIHFFENHRYYTQSAIASRETLKQEHLQKLKAT